MDYLIVFALGGLCGGVAALWWHFERLVAGSNALRIERRQVEFLVDESAVAGLSEAMVMAWLDRRGLVWMPKGMEKIVEGKSR